MPQVDFALDWLAHVSAAGLRASALIGATDGKASRMLGRAGARCLPTLTPALALALALTLTLTKARAASRSRRQ